MPTYRISVINHIFSSCNHHDAPTLDAANKQGLQSALAIGTEEIVNGTPFFGAEVRIEDGDKLVHRFVVSIGTSPLQ